MKSIKLLLILLLTVLGTKNLWAGDNVVAVTMNGSTTEYDDFRTACIALPRGCTATLTLLKDCSAYVGLDVVGGSNITIDGNGHTLSMAWPVEIYCNSTLTIKSGTFNTDNTFNSTQFTCMFFVYGGTMIVEDGSFYTDKCDNVVTNSYDWKSNAGTLIVNNGTFYSKDRSLGIESTTHATLNGGTFSGGNGAIYAADGATSILGEGKGYYNTDGSTMTHDEGKRINQTVMVSDAAAYTKIYDTSAAAYKVKYYPSLDTAANAVFTDGVGTTEDMKSTLVLLRDGNLENISNRANNYNAISAGKYTLTHNGTITVDGHLYIQDGTFKFSNSSGKGFVVENCLTVQGGTIDSSDKDDETAVYVAKGTYESTGGVIKGGKNNYGLVTESASTQLLLTGGTYSGGKGSISVDDSHRIITLLPKGYGYFNEAGSPAVITFSSDNTLAQAVTVGKSEAYLTEVTTVNSKKVTRNKYYPTFDEAFSAAIDNAGHVVLNNDCIHSTLATLSPGANVTISGGQYTLTLGEEIRVYGGTLTIQNGTFTTSEDFDNNRQPEMFCVTYGYAPALTGTLTVNGGTFRTTNCDTPIRVAYKSQLTVNGGTFYGMDRGLLNESGVVTLNGGTFSGGNGGIYTYNNIGSILGKNRGYFSCDDACTPLALNYSVKSINHDVKVVDASGMEAFSTCTTTNGSTTVQTKRYYDTFNNALLAASQSAAVTAITLKNNAVYNGTPINADANITISGGSNTVTMATGMQVYGTLTIKDGTFTTGSEWDNSNGSQMFNVAKGTSDAGGNLTVSNGTFTGTLCDTPIRATAGTLTIKEGKFQGKERGLIASGDSVTLYSGTFSGGSGGIYADKGVASLLATGRNYFTMESEDVWVPLSVGSAQSIDETCKVDGDDVYITSASDLTAFAKKVNAGTISFSTVYLDDDIDMSGTSFTPIGTTSHPFNGTFDGQGHRIRNLSVSRNENYAGLLGAVAGENTIIKNVIIDASCSVNSTASAVGGLVGGAFSSSGSVCKVTIMNCGNEASVTAAYDGGGLIGGVYGNDNAVLVITNCYNTGAIYSYNNQAATLCGYARKNYTFTNCYNIGSISGGESGKYFYRYNTGGTASVTNCYDINGNQTSADGTTVGVTKITDYRINTGELCNLLNQNGIVFTQIKGTDKYPVPGDKGYVYVPTGNEIAAEAPATGDGSADSPYEIATAGNLVWFANQVDDEKTTICGKLTADINLQKDQTMIGATTSKYSGTFDGDGHTVTVNYVGTENYTALFRYISNATIKNIKTAGNISTAYQVAAGIVAYSEGTSYINHCESSVTITSTVVGDGTHGGILGNGHDTANLTNDLFNGKLLGSSTTNCGGLIGWSKSAANITSCLFIPSEVTVKASGSSTLSRGNGVSCMYSFYVTALGTEQGLQASSDELKSGEVCYLLNRNKSDGSQTWYQTIGTDNIPVMDDAHATVYGGSDACSSTSAYSNTRHEYNGTDYDEKDGVYFWTCSVCNKAVEDHYQAATLESGFYQINNKGNLIWFAKLVNSGKGYVHADLNADIDLGDNQIMIGTGNSKYRGCFNGLGHTITVNYKAHEDVVALFRYIYDAEIYNLGVNGSITTDRRYAGGIVGDCYGLTMSKCWCTVNIASSYSGEAYHGGIVALGGKYWGTHVTMENVIFNGSLLGRSSTYCGGFMGTSYSLDGESVPHEFTNCVFAPTEKTMGTTNSKTFGEYSTITNCYYTTTLGGAQGTAVSADDVKSGKLCYTLSGGQTNGTQLWYQTIGTDDIPFPQKTHSTVYGGDMACSATSDYSNSLHDISQATYDANGLCNYTCPLCNKTALIYQEPALTDNVYQIANKGNLIWFANKVNYGLNPDGSSTTGINGRLTADIDLSDDQIMIGTSTYKYKGNFDGDGHTVTVNYTATENYTALFRYVSGITISNLKTAGAISTAYQFAAGIVAYSEGTTNITHSQSSVAITSTVSGDGSHGGLVANNHGNINLNFVLFNGKMEGGNTTSCGGLIGWSATSSTITNALFFPSNVSLGTSDASTLARGNSVTAKSCYYSSALGTAQGTSVTWDGIKSGAVCYSTLNGKVTDGTQAWYQTLDTDTIPVWDSTHGTVYGDEDACSPTADYSNTSHKFDIVYDENGKFSWTCPVCGKSYLHYQEPVLADNFYQISNLGNFIWFAQKVNSGSTGIKGKLTADIDLGDDQTMIGTGSHKFSGTFDGGGHSITVNYVATAEYTALFRYVDNATIQNLETKGSIQTAYKFAAGLVGYIVRGNIKRCTSSICISSTVDGDGTHGGLVAHIPEGGDYTYLTNVIFSGSLLGPTTTNCGGIIGWANSYISIGSRVDTETTWTYISKMSVTNCIFAPTEVTVSTTGSSTIARNPHGYKLSNAYYSTAFGTEEGTAVDKEDVKSGKLCYEANNKVTDGTQGWYQTLGTDATPLPFSSHGTVYGGNEACPYTLSYSNETHPEIDVHGNCTRCGKLLGPVHISGIDDFATFAKLSNEGTDYSDITVYIDNDIDLSTISAISSGDEKGYLCKTFSGTLEGNGHTLKNSSHALFYRTTGATIENVTLDGFAVTDQTSLIARTSSYTNFGHITVKSSSIKHTSDDMNNFGMIVGYSDKDTISYCTVESGCSVTVNRRQTGGLVGKAFRGKISYCRNSATITADADDVGGIVGKSGDSSDGAASTIEYCLNTGTINGDDQCGGIVGYYREGTITNCVNTGTITSKDGNNHDNQGGITGKISAATCNNSINFGSVVKANSQNSQFAIYGGKDGDWSATGNEYYCDVKGKHFDTGLVYDDIMSGKYALSIDWLYQDIDNGTFTATKYPVPLPEAGEVYSNILCDGTQSYSNKYKSTGAHDSDPDVNGICQTCGNNVGTGNLHIKTAAFLCEFAKAVNSGRDYSNSTVYLDNDIDMGGVKNFPMIGSGDYPFNGTFNGQGHRIKNLAITGENYTGLFGYVGGNNKAVNTVIKNVIIDSSCSNTSTGTGVAGLIGCVTSTSGQTCNVTIENCGNEANISSDRNVGGIMGAVFNNDNTVVTINNCYNTGAITGRTLVSALGYVRKNYTITNCYNSGTLTATQNTPSLYRTDSTDGTTSVSNCFDVNGTQDGVTKITADQVASGELCFILNGNKAAGTWGHTSDDTHPVLSGEGMQHYSRTMANQWGTICLPFDAEIGDDYDFYTLTAVSNDALTLTKVETLAAGTPAIVRRNTGATGIDISAVSGTTFADAPVADTPTDDLTLTGAFTQTDITDQDGYIISNNAFWNIASLVEGTTNKVYCSPFRAYLAGSISSGAKQLTIGGIDDAPTTIETIDSPLGNLDDAAIYDLNGRRINNLQKGVNIVKFNNGVTKKVIIR